MTIEEEVARVIEAAAFDSFASALRAAGSAGQPANHESDPIVSH